MLNNTMTKGATKRLIAKASRSILILAVAILSLCAGSSFADEESVYDSGGRHDPFTPWVTDDGRLQILKTQEEKSHSELKIEGIIYDKYDISYAIVNEKVVKISDTVDGYQVLKIEENKVVFIKEGQIKEVEMKKEE
jgi:hypothetical protein